MSGKSEPASVSAMKSKHFITQNAINGATSKDDARAPIYIPSLLGALAALGIYAQAAPAILFIKAVHVSSLASIIVGSYMMAGPLAAFDAYQSFGLRETEKHSLR